MSRLFFGKRLLRFPGDNFLIFLGHRIRELGTYSMRAVSPTKRPQLQSYFEATGRYSCWCQVHGSYAQQ
jgi:hypothetical protein